MTLCALCPLDMLDDPHWDSRAECWVCTDCCEQCQNDSGESVDTGRDSAPGELGDTRTAQLLAAVARTGRVVR